MLQVLLWLLLGLFKIQILVYLFFFSRNSYTIFTCTFKRSFLKKNCDKEDKDCTKIHMCLNYSKYLLKSSNLLGLSARVMSNKLCQNSLFNNATFPWVTVRELFPYFPSLFANVFSANFSLYSSYSVSFLGPTLLSVLFKEPNYPL